MRDEDSFALLKCRTVELLSFPSLRDRDRPVCWANGPMASHEPSRVPPPHDNAAAAARPKPLWQPWSDSDGDFKELGHFGKWCNNFFYYSQMIEI